MLQNELNWNVTGLIVRVHVQTEDNERTGSQGVPLCQVYDESGSARSEVAVNTCTRDMKKISSAKREIHGILVYAFLFYVSVVN